jgi:hypothetical protein
LAGIVDEERDGVGAAKRSEISQPAVLPEERARLRAEAEHRDGIGDRIGRGADDLVSVVERERNAFIPAGSAEIDGLGVLPQDGVGFRVSNQGIDRSGIGQPGEVALGVDSGWPTAVGAALRA